jgi:putative DNA methylase
MDTPYRKKLIEVALPLDAINAASAKEKSIRHGHPSTLHLWWARRPLAACRAVIFASLVDDPSSRPEEFPTEEAQAIERRRLFRMIEAMVPWENSSNAAVIAAARAEIRRSAGATPPSVVDPFAGGGSIPLEAQRLGLRAFASDLNPVAVLVNKALIEIPAKFANQPPVHPGQPATLLKREWIGGQGLAGDVRHYGEWMRKEAKRRIGQLYPKVATTGGKGKDGDTVAAWLWARTVVCPNPACGARMPLISSMIISDRKDGLAWLDPHVDKSQHPPKITFSVRKEGKPSEGPKIGRGAKFRCLACSQVAEDEHIKREGRAGRITYQLLALVVDGPSGREFIASPTGHEEVANSAHPEWQPMQPLANDPRNIWCINYGIDSFDKLFTRRQLTALATFSGLVEEVRKQIQSDATGQSFSQVGSDDNGDEGQSAAYADAVATYLAFAVDKCADYWTTIATWMPRGTVGHAFSKQAIPMTWDFPEANPFSEFHCAWKEAVHWVAKQLEEAPHNVMEGHVQQLDAATALAHAGTALVSTDPPYYDNISYADLSDFFYVWLRRSLANVYPNLFGTLLVPKRQELVAAPHRFDGSKSAAQSFFVQGLGDAFARMRSMQHPDFPLTIFYAFKQTEAEEKQERGALGTPRLASTGWETMLEGLLQAGFSVTGTWPMRTERSARSIGLGTNALASSIVLVCRPRSEDASVATRREFIRTLYSELPKALDLLIKGAVDVSPIAPVDLAQAAIGPGMAIFSQYSEVLEADGSRMRVRMALELINGALDAYFSHQEGEQDSPTRFCVNWYRTHGTSEGPFGEAQVLSRAVDVDLAALDRRGLLTARGGRVQLKRISDYPEGDWDPAAIYPPITWEASHRLVAALAREGVQGAASIARRLGGKGEEARSLAYLLFTEATKRGWSEDALGYNNLVVSWPDVVKAAAAIQDLKQGRLGI